MNTIRVFHSFIKSNILILLILAINTAYSIRIGLISNTTFIASNISQTFSNMSCTQCTCTALIAFAVGWNCMTNNKTCYLIKNYTSTDIGLIRTGNATFFFQKIPPEPLTTTVYAMTTQTPSITTSGVDPCSFRWNTTGTVILGNGSSGLASNRLNRPFGIYIDNNDILYVTDFGNNRIQKMILSGGVVTTIAGNITAGNTTTLLNGPEFVFSDEDQNIYVPDYYNYRIQKFPSGSLIGTTIAGTGTSGNTANQFNGLKNLWLDSSYQYLYQVESVNHRVMRFSTNSTNGTAGTIVAGGTGAGNNTNQLSNPQGIYYDTSTNSMYITNCDGNTIMKWIPGASTGSFVVGTSGQKGNISSLLNCPLDVRVDQYQNIYVADSRNYRIQMFCLNGGNDGITIAGGYGTGTTNMHLAQPRSLQFDSQMNLYVSDINNHRIIKFNKL